MATIKLDDLIDVPRLRLFARNTIVPLESTIGSLAEAMQALADAEIATETGLHGLRYYNGLLQYATYDYDGVTPIGTENPSQEGWYEYRNNEYTASADTAVDGEKTYFERSTTWNTMNLSGAGGDTNPFFIDDDGDIAIDYDHLEVRSNA